MTNYLLRFWNDISGTLNIGLGLGINLTGKMVGGGGATFNRITGADTRVTASGDIRIVET